MSPVKQQRHRAPPKRQSNQTKKNDNIPMAYVKRPRRRRGTRVTRDLNRIIVSGRDLVVPTPRSLPTGASETSVFQCIPANPIFWSGTRVSRQASMYQVYRPRKFLVHYKPQVAVTNPGLVIYGTLFQDATVTASELQQVLNTSNGGGISPCYLSFSSRVDLRALQLRQFNTIGNPSSTDNVPFLWVATYSGYSPSAISTSSAPGWVEVEWEFEFMSGNPGTGNTGRGIFTFDETSAQSFNESRVRRGLRAFDWNMPFGVPLGIIKEVARPILRHIGVVLLQGAESTSWRYGIGKILTWISSSLRSSRASSTTTLRDDDGSTVDLPDDTPVILLMCGLPQPDDTSEAALGRISFSEFHVIASVDSGAAVRKLNWRASNTGSYYPVEGGEEQLHITVNETSVDFTFTPEAYGISINAVAPTGEDNLCDFISTEEVVTWRAPASLYHWDAMPEPPIPQALAAIAQDMGPLDQANDGGSDEEEEQTENATALTLTSTQRAALMQLLQQVRV